MKMQRTQTNTTSIVILCYHRSWPSNEIKGMVKNYLLEKTLLNRLQTQKMKNSIPGHEIQEPPTLTADGNIKIWAGGSDLPLNCVTPDCPITSTSFTSVTHQSFNFTDPTVSNGTHTFSSLHIFLVFLFFSPT